MSKWTLVTYADGDRGASKTQVVTGSMEMDKNRCLVFKASNYGSPSLLINKDEWISVQGETAEVEVISTTKHGARSRPRKRVKK
jgi:hypothetical protein